MIHSVKNEKRIWAGTLLIALVSLILIFLPTVSVFSQTAHIPSDDSSSYNIKRRQYIDLLGSVFDYVHRNYVDEVDPEILYQGAMKGPPHLHNCDEHNQKHFPINQCTAAF